MTSSRIPTPQVLAGVVKAMQAGHTTSTGIRVASGFALPTVNACLKWMRLQGHVHTYRERPPRIPGQIWRGLQCFHALVSVPPMPERDSERAVGPRCEPWDFAALMQAHPLGSRPQSMPTGRIHKMRD